MKRRQKLSSSVSNSAPSIVGTSGRVIAAQNGFSSADCRMAALLTPLCSAAIIARSSADSTTLTLPRSPSFDVHGDRAMRLDRRSDRQLARLISGYSWALVQADHPDRERASFEADSVKFQDTGRHRSCEVIGAE